MKKIVFLLCMLVLISPISTKAVDTYDCKDSVLEVKLIVETNGKSITITKRGINPFQTKIYEEGKELYINDVICSDDSYVLYGYTHIENEDTYYDTYLLALDSDGNILFQEITDYGDLEEIKDAFIIDEVLMTFINQTQENRDFDFTTTFVKTYNPTFESLGFKEIDTEIVGFKENNKVILINYGYDDTYELGLKSDLTEMTSTDVFSINSQYEESFTLDFINDGTLNGSIVSNGMTIIYPGNYVFIYNEQIYNFTVNPLISGIEHLSVYNDEVIIEVSAGNAILNNEIYLSGTPIVIPGNYVFEVTGHNDYSSVIEFTITPNVEGVINGHVYSDELNISFDGEGFLNNNFVTSPLVVSDNGEYNLRISGVNGYSETYEFSIITLESGFDITDFIKNIDIFILGIVIIGGVIIIKKK